MSGKLESGATRWHNVETDGSEEQNLRHLSNGQNGTAPFPFAEGRAAVDPRGRTTSLACLQDQLRVELQRGHEYLNQIEQELSERRERLDSWPVFEKVCGKNPLPQLAESILIDERIAQFMGRWLGQHEERLVAVTRELELSRQQREHLTQ